ncbi:MAG: 50S ribosomal protein L11 [Candidatus Methanofastidiosa archaeon]|jgi:large subunit ribosomal protein L11|nr:50S ribosomal protein L11 [Candidatus Methanofastidiosa archaeon]
MAKERSVDSLVDGGKATAGPPLGPALGPLGINVGKVVAEINEKTKAFQGMKVPVKIIVDDKKNFRVEVGVPPASALVLKELNLEKGSSTPSSSKVGDISLENIVKIAKMKQPSSLSPSVVGVVKEVLGTCVSMGVTCEGKDPRTVQKEINEGKYDNILK